MRHESSSDDDDSEDIRIEKILSRRKVKRKGATVQEYLVKWEEYGDEHNTWETRKDLIYDGFKTQVESFDAALKEASAPRSKLGRQRRTRSKTPQARSKKILSSLSPSSPPSSSSEQVPVKETDHASESLAGQTSQEVQSGLSMSNNLTSGDNSLLGLLFLCFLAIVILKVCLAMLKEQAASGRTYNGVIGRLRLFQHMTFEGMKELNFYALCTLIMDAKRLQVPVEYPNELAAASACCSFLTDEKRMSSAQEILTGLFVLACLFRIGCSIPKSPANLFRWIATACFAFNLLFRDASDVDSLDLIFGSMAVFVPAAIHIVMDRTPTRKASPLVVLECVLAIAFLVITYSVLGLFVVQSLHDHGKPLLKALSAAHFCLSFALVSKAIPTPNSRTQELNLYILSELVVSVCYVCTKAKLRHLEDIRPVNSFHSGSPASSGDDTLAFLLIHTAFGLLVPLSSTASSIYEVAHVSRQATSKS